MSSPRCNSPHSSIAQCPEELSEFLKQRRRWTVSGTVNTIRVLIYWHSYVRHGGFNIIHIVYQVLVKLNS